MSPEHNRSLPAAIKNAIDWGSRPWGQNSWAGKAVGVVGASPSAAGTAMMQQHLRNILAAEGANTLTTPEVFLQYTEGLVDDQFNITKRRHAQVPARLDRPLRGLDQETECLIAADVGRGPAPCRRRSPALPPGDQAPRYVGGLFFDLSPSTVEKGEDSFGVDPKFPCPAKHLQGVIKKLRNQPFG